MVGARRRARPEHRHALAALGRGDAAAGRGRERARRPGRPRSGRRRARRATAPRRRSASSTRSTSPCCAGTPARSRRSSASKPRCAASSRSARATMPPSSRAQAERTLGLVASVTGPRRPRLGRRDGRGRSRTAHPLLAAITGTGCMSSALTGCFLAVNARSPARQRPPRRSSRSASPARTRRAGAQGPGSFHVALYDALAALDPGDARRPGTRRREGCTRSSPTSRRRGERSPPARRSCSCASRRRPRRSSRAAAASASSVSTFVVNDDVDAALALGADGVHLGQDDAGAEARARARACCSAGRRRRSRRRVAADADYLGAGPVWDDAVEDRRRPADRPRRARARSARRSTVPVVAIGGIDAANAARVHRGGRRRRRRRSAPPTDPALRRAVDAAVGAR